MQNRSLVITRGQIGQVGSALFGLGALVALTAFLWTGTLADFTALGLIVCLGGLGLWAAMTPQELRAFFRGRQIRRSTGVILSTLLLTAIVTVTYIVVQRAVIVSDLTIDRRFSLSEQSLEIIRVVERSPRPVRILGFYRPQDLLQREIDDAYWQLYESASNGAITRQYVDPIREPGLAAPFARALALNYYVFVGFVQPDGSLDLSTVTPVANIGAQERSMTEAISRLMAGGHFKVYFERGMNTLDPLDNSQAGMSILNNNLQANGLITDALSLSALAAAGQPIPRDASALIIARPQRDMTAAELAVVREYVERGGTLFVAADFFPTDEVFLEEGSLFNDFLWEAFGVRMTNAVAVDTRSAGPSALHVVSAQVVAENTLASGLNMENDPSTATLFHLARVIEVNTQPPVPNGTVIFTSELSWGETDTRAIIERSEFIADAQSDIRGPLSLVAFAENPHTGAKLVLVGDGEFLTNGYTSRETQFYATGNATLFMNSVGWLTGFTQAVEFAPRAFTTTPVLFVGGPLLDGIAFLTVFVMPGTMVLLAVVLYWRRYRPT